MIHIQVDDEQRKWDLAKKVQHEKALVEQRKIVIAVQPAVLQIDIVAPKVKNIFEDAVLERKKAQKLQMEPTVSKMNEIANQMKTTEMTDGNEGSSRPTSRIEEITAEIG